MTARVKSPSSRGGITPLMRRWVALVLWGKGPGWPCLACLWPVPRFKGETRSSRPPFRILSMLPEDQEPGLGPPRSTMEIKGARGPGGSHRREPSTFWRSCMGSSGCRNHLVEGLPEGRWTPGSNPGSFAPRLCGVSTDAPLRRRPIPLHKT